MWLLIFLLIVTVLGIWSIHKTREFSTSNFISMIGTMIAGTILVIMLLMLVPMLRVGERNDIIKFTSFKETVRAARANPHLSEIERAALLTKIAEFNGWLAMEKYWVNTQWSLWHLDEVKDLQPLE